MSRLDSTVGFLAVAGTVAVLALVAAGEGARLTRASKAWEGRQIEIGAELFDAYCANCHGPNTTGGLGPPLDERSGLHGGDEGPGIAWRLEALGWDRRQPYAYVQSVIASGRPLSTRPGRYPGNRAPEPASAAGLSAAGTAVPPVMAMPAWGPEAGGALRLDQIDALSRYITAFRDAVPSDPQAARAAARVNRRQVESAVDALPSATPAAALRSVAPTAP